MDWIEFHMWITKNFIKTCNMFTFTAAVYIFHLSNMLKLSISVDCKLFLCKTYRNFQ